MIKKPLYLALAACMATTPVLADDVKVLVKSQHALKQIPQESLIQDYGQFKLYRMSATKANKLAANNSAVNIVSDMDQLLFDSFTFDTQRIHNQYNFDANALLTEDGSGLRVVQFTGPVKQEWLNSLSQHGVKLIHYVANNGYLVWTDTAASQALESLQSRQHFIQFNAPFTAQFKKGSTIDEALRRQQSTQGTETINVVVQLADSPENNRSKAVINQLAQTINSPWRQVMKFHSTRITVSVQDLPTLLNLVDSFWVSEYFERTLNDEIQNIILTGDLTPDGSQPAMTGYEGFLSTKGFSTNPTDYPVVDITDDGIGDGSVNSGDPTFHENGLLANPSRLSYVGNCTSEATGEGIGGHGHLNTNIVGGFESRVGFPYIDPNGYIRTQGVNPYARIAGTRIFDPSGFDLSKCGNSDLGLIESVSQNGAKIMSNSWGCSGCAGSYDDSSQAFDVGTRDADGTASGNQELITIFAAGNSGPSAATVGTPGNGKNMITVGASENYRPIDEDGNWNDGCGIGPSGADSAMDVIGFSSRGPSPGNRTKPEVIAPGTHIHGTASTSSGYNGSGVCDQYRPGGQTVIAASSGTSHSTPAVAGVASLAYYWLENPPTSMLGTFSSPSPAMMKAYLVAHPTYLTGVSGNDSLPSNNQGYGMPNLDEMFDNTNKFLLDQSTVFDNTGESFSWVGAVSDPSKPVRVVMTYTDEPGAVGTSPQVNNLDLSVTTGGNTYLGNNFSGQYSTTGGSADSVNNYEAVFLSPGTATDINIEIMATNIAGDGVPNTGDATDQDFALVCYNCVQDPTFTLSTTTNSVAVCSPNDAVYQLDVNSILGYTGLVTLSTTGQPAGSSVALSANPVSAPGSSTLTIGNIANTLPGSYVINAVGNDGSDQRSVNLGLDIFDQSPNTPTLQSPTNGATGVDGNMPSFSWDAVSGVQTYLFELADDSGFSNVIESVQVDDNNYTSALVLNPDSTYYWRVTAENTCGQAPISSTFSFTTLNKVCWTGSETIPDSSSVGIDTSLNISANETITGLQVSVGATHGWPGDLVFTLTHVNTGTSVTLMDQPGVPDSTYGCSVDDVDVVFDDTSVLPVEDYCAVSPPGIGGNLKPDEPLSAFHGETLNGEWRLNASDPAAGVTGSLSKFCLFPESVALPDLIFKDGFEGVTPP